MESFRQSGFRIVSPLSEKLPSYSPMASNLSNTDHSISAKVVHRYPFSSSLKRMSVIVRTTFKKTTSWIIICKGAPEVVGQHLITVPRDYEATYLLHMKAGRRVLVLAYKLFKNENPSFPSISRIEAEKDLNFLGFLVFSSALKPSTKSIIRELRGANFPISIVTGDNVYTAADVARKLSLISNETSLLLLEENVSDQTSAGVHWCVSPPKNSTGLDVVSIPFDESTVAELALKFVLCVSGSSLSRMESHLSPDELKGTLRKLCPHASIFSRVNPSQKELITKALNLAGYHTLFCGDGTNDCGTKYFLNFGDPFLGALKAAHVGVSIINNIELEKKVQVSYMQHKSSSLKVMLSPRGSDTS